MVKPTKTIANKTITKTERNRRLKQQKKQQKRHQQQLQQQQQPVYTKRQKSKRHKKQHSYSEPDRDDPDAWKPSRNELGDCAPGKAVGKQFVSKSLKQFMFLKRIASLPDKERRQALRHSGQRSNPYQGDVTGMRRRVEPVPRMRRRANESEGKFLARVERHAQSAVLLSQYKAKYGQAPKAKRDETVAEQQKQPKQKQQLQLQEEELQQRQQKRKLNQQQQRSHKRQQQQRPAQLQEVVSEPPKFLAKLKRRRATAAAAAAAAAASSTSASANRHINQLDRALLLT